jgi:hypothetical protein
MKDGQASSAFYFIVSRTEAIYSTNPVSSKWYVLENEWTLYGRLECCSFVCVGSCILLHCVDLTCVFVRLADGKLKCEDAFSPGSWHRSASPHADCSASHLQLMEAEECTSRLSCHENGTFRKQRSVISHDGVAKSRLRPPPLCSAASARSSSRIFAPFGRTRASSFVHAVA